MAKRGKMSALWADINSGGAHSPRLEIWLGSAIAGLFFVVFLGWAAFAPLDAAAITEGVVSVAGNRQAVQPRNGGVVTALNIVEGQTVKRDEVLLKIGTPDTDAVERSLAGEVISLLAQRARLRAESAGQVSFAAPPEFAALTGRDKTLADVAMAEQRHYATVRAQSNSAATSVLQQRLDQYRVQNEGLARQVGFNRKQQDLVGAELDGLKKLAVDGYVSTNRVRNTERVAAQLDGETSRNETEISRNISAMAEINSQILSTRKKVLETISDEMVATEARLVDRLPKWSAAKEIVVQSLVKAPASGRVVGLKIYTVGGVVSAGEHLMDIVPQDRGIVIDAMLNPTDAAEVQIGMPAMIRLSVFHDRKAPVLQAIVSDVSADSFVDEQSGVRFFSIEVRIPEAELLKISKAKGHYDLRPGLNVEVVVPLRKRTALTYLTEPIGNAFSRVGREP